MSLLCPGVCVWGRPADRGCGMYCLNVVSCAPAKHAGVLGAHAAAECADTLVRYRVEALPPRKRARMLKLTHALTNAAIVPADTLIGHRRSRNIGGNGGRFLSSWPEMRQYE